MDWDTEVYPNGLIGHTRLRGTQGSYVSADHHHLAGHPNQKPRSHLENILFLHVSYIPSVTSLVSLESIPTDTNLSQTLMTSPLG